MLPIKIDLPKSFFNIETRCDYTVSKQSKELWAVLLDLLCEFDSVCKKHNIEYSLDAGSMLGAVRHKGFIPWDDDVDVILLRPEFEKLCKIAPQEFSHPYFWQTNDTDPGSMRRHAQLRNSETTCILKSETENSVPIYSFNQGIALDVFVLDAIPEDRNVLSAWRKELAEHIDAMWEMRHLFYKNNRPEWLKEAILEEAHRYDEIVSQFNDKNCQLVSNVSLIPERKESDYFKKEIFLDLTDYEFEGFSFPGPRRYEDMLNGYYGDWHKYVINNGMHGEVLLDTHKSYTSYLQKQKDNNAENLHPLTKVLIQRNRAWKECEDKGRECKEAWKECEVKDKELERTKNEMESILNEMGTLKVSYDELYKKYQKWNPSRFLHIFRKKDKA